MSDYDDNDVYYNYDDENNDDDDENNEYYVKTEYGIKRTNGALVVVRANVTGVKRPGQDWGEADFSEDRQTRLASEWKPLSHAAFEVLGRKLKDGQSLELDPEAFDHAEQVVSRWLAWKKVQA